MLNSHVPPPESFFPEVHKELTKSWKAPFLSRTRFTGASAVTTLNGGVAQGYVDVPQVECAFVVHLSPSSAATLSGHPWLPSKTCKFTSSLTAKAYNTSGQASFALHAMAILQVYQAKALKKMEESSPDPEVLHEHLLSHLLYPSGCKGDGTGPRSGNIHISGHLWLNLVEMKDAKKVRFPYTPVSQASLFSEEFAKQFSAVKKQTHKKSRPLNTSCFGAVPPPEEPGPQGSQAHLPAREVDQLRAMHRPRIGLPANRWPPACPQATKNPLKAPKRS